MQLYAAFALCSVGFNKKYVVAPGGPQLLPCKAALGLTLISADGHPMSESRDVKALTLQTEVLV